jgi:hypothetical protein
MKNMNPLIQLSWQKNRTGYEVVEINRDNVDWSGLGQGGAAISAASNLSAAALRALDHWREQLAPNNFKTESQIRILEPIDRSPVHYVPPQKLYIELANTKKTQAGILKFANEYGLLWRDAPSWVATWYTQIDRLRQAIGTWSNEGDANPKAFKILYDDFFDETGIEDRIRPTLELRPNGGFEFAFEVSDLLSTMWLQLGLAVADNSRFIQCSECSNFIEIGRESGRRHKGVCSNRCRVRHHRRIKKGAVSDSEVGS